MKKVTKMAAQGDLLIRRIDNRPDVLDGAKLARRTVVGHSETGHHHAVVGEARWVETSRMLGVLEVVADSAALQHERDFDTHEPLRLERGVYEIRRQREYVPGGWRRVED